MSSEARPPVVELRGVTKTYPGPPSFDALQPCTLSVAAGDFLTIVGPSGSGKSTLLNILGLLDRPTTGSYRLDGVDVGEVDDGRRAGWRARSVGFVFQSFQLLRHRSSLDNVMLAGLYAGDAEPVRRRRALEALDRVGLAHKASARPSHLSGGEQQRVAVARAIAAGPSLLLCDEPTGNLDSVTASGVLDVVRDLHRGGMTVVLITHDDQVAREGSRRASIHDGVLVEVGPDRWRS